MLVFTRRKDEAVMIGEGVEVRVLRVGKDGVRLGIVAPPEVAVHRKEIYVQIREANRSAVVPAATAEAVSARLRKRG